MASRKKNFGDRLDVGWQHGIDLDKNSRKVQCKYCQKNYQWRYFSFQTTFGLHLQGCWVVSASTKKC